jgi:hypothetical protein
LLIFLVVVLTVYDFLHWVTIPFLAKRTRIQDQIQIRAKNLQIGIQETKKSDKDPKNLAFYFSNINQCTKQCCRSGMLYPRSQNQIWPFSHPRSRIQKIFHPGSYMKCEMQTYLYFFLASYDFRRSLSHNQKDPLSQIWDMEKIHTGSGSQIQGVKNIRSRISIRNTSPNIFLQSK